MCTLLFDSHCWKIIPAPTPAPVLPPAVIRQEDSVVGVFGVLGENNVWVTSLEFSFAYGLKMVFCYQNCSDLPWEKNCSSDWE